MTLTPEDALELCRKMRMDLTQLQGRLTDVMETLAALPPSNLHARICPTCGVTTRGPISLAEHVYNSHGGPVPDHMLKAERLAGIDCDYYLPNVPANAADVSSFGNTPRRKEGAA